MIRKSRQGERALSGRRPFDTRLFVFYSFHHHRLEHTIASVRDQIVKLLTYREFGETQRTDREILLRQLVQAEQGVAEGKAFIAEQQRLIVELERDDCHDTAETMRLLEAFLLLQRSREEDRARILDELSE